MIQARGDYGGDGTQPGPRVSSMACAAASCWFSTFELGTLGCPEAMHRSLECFTWASDVLRKRSQQLESQYFLQEGPFIFEKGRKAGLQPPGWGPGRTDPSLSVWPCRAMLKEPYIDKTRVAVFGKVSCRLG